MATEAPAKPIQGITLTDCTSEASKPDFPQFRVKGTVDGNQFEALVNLEIGGRDANIQHVSGAKIDGEDSPDLFDLIYQTEAYKTSVH